jgi:tartrate dehydratase beta subunit/fumarate hydratase class I family protein
MMNTICIFNLLTFLLINIAQAQTASSEVKELNIEDFCKGSSINLNGKIYTIKDDGFCNAIKDLKEENQTPDANLVNDINYTFKNLDPTNMVVKNKCKMANTFLC